MTSQSFSAAYTVVQYNTGGGQTLQASVAPGDVIGGSLNYFPNVSGGTATMNFQYWNGNKPVGNAVSLEISKVLPNQSTTTVPENVDRFVMTFGDVTFPAGSVTISLNGA